MTSYRRVVATISLLGVVGSLVLAVGCTATSTPTSEGVGATVPTESKTKELEARLLYYSPDTLLGGMQLAARRGTYNGELGLWDILGYFHSNPSTVTVDGRTGATVLLDLAGLAHVFQQPPLDGGKAWPPIDFSVDHIFGISEPCFLATFLFLYPDDPRASEVEQMFLDAGWDEDEMRSYITYIHDSTMGQK